MPYIEQDRRAVYRDSIDSIPEIACKGELEYVIFKIMLNYMTNHDFKYSRLHDTVYAVHHAAHEFERTYLDCREDIAKEENGEIS